MWIRQIMVAGVVVAAARTASAQLIVPVSQTRLVVADAEDCLEFESASDQATDFGLFDSFVSAGDSDYVSSFTSASQTSEILLT